MTDNSIQTELRDATERQVRELREQISSINKSLAQHGFDIEEIGEDAENLMQGAQKNVRRAAGHVQKEAGVVAKAAQKAPMATSTVLTLVGVVGFGLGYLASRAHLDSHRNWF